MEMITAQGMTMPNLGLGFDSFHMFATNTALDELDMAIARLASEARVNA